MKANALKGTDIRSKFDLTSNVIIITGGAGLLGVQHAEAILEAGGNPVLIDNNSDNLNRAVAHFKKEFNKDVLGYCADVTDRTAIKEAIDNTLARFNRIDVLINNASMTVKGASENFQNYFTCFEDYPIDLWEKAVKISLTGMIIVTQLVGKEMSKNGRGVIINIASTAGLVGPDHRIYEGVKNQYGERPFNTPIAYSATKSAILGMTRYLATYWAPKNIRVNALSPGGVYDGHDETFVRNYSYRVPLNRMAKRDEYKAAIVFLASDASSYMTGSNLIIDGGWTCW